MSTPTFIDGMEMIAEEVSEWGKEYVNRIVDSLSPDGRPFGMEQSSERDQLRLYVSQLRGNKDAWLNWVRSKTQFIQTVLSGLPEDKILSVHPGDIALRFAYVYSHRMEQLLAEETKKAALRPTAPILPVEAMPAGEIGVSDVGPG